MISRRPSLHELQSAPFISLRTFRANGTSAQAAVWPLAQGDRLWVRTTASTFKVKRLRNNPRAEVALCNGSGRTILSAFVPMRARVLEDQSSLLQSQALMQAKYGWQATLIRTIHKIRGVANTMVVIELTPE
jgi:PPOX class probable F420-dependent enzyme